MSGWGVGAWGRGRGHAHTHTVALGGVRLQPLGPSSHLMEGPLSLVARGCRPGVWAEPREKAKVVLTSCGYRSLCSCLRKSSALSDPTSSSKAIFSSCGRHRTQPSGRPPRLAVPEDREPTGSARAFLGRGRVKTVWPDGPPLGQAVDAPGPGGLCPLEGARAAGTRACEGHSPHCQPGPEAEGPGLQGPRGQPAQGSAVPAHHAPDTSSEVRTREETGAPWRLAGHSDRRHKRTHSGPT